MGMNYKTGYISVVSWVTLQNFLGIDPIAPSIASVVLYPLNLTESIRKREGDTPGKEQGGGTEGQRERESE